MKKLTIISYYSLVEYLVSIKKLFESYFYNVSNFPLFQYAYDANDKIPDYKEKLNDYLKNSKIDIVIWWFLDVPCEVFNFIKENNPKIYFIMYNCDDPNNVNIDTFEKGKIFNLIMTPCKSNLSNYKMLSHARDVMFNPPGFDPKFFYKINRMINY